MARWLTVAVSLLVCGFIAGCDDDRRPPPLATSTSAGIAPTPAPPVGVPGATAPPLVTPASPTGSTTAAITRGTFPPPPAGQLGVIAVDPADFARGVPPGSSIALTFSEPVDPALVQAEAWVDGGNGSLLGTWSAGPDRRIHTFQPMVPLQVASHYAVRVSDALVSANGNPIAAPFRTAFGTIDVPRQPLRAGAAVIDITPPVGVPLGGYGSDDRRNAILTFLPGADHDPNNYVVLFKPSLGIRDAIRVKALVLHDGVREVLIMSIDAVGASAQMFDDVAPRILNQTGILPGDMFLCGTHTHHGPGDVAHDRLLQHIAMDLFDARIYEPLRDAVVQAAVDAHNALRPAELGVTMVHEDRIGRNRRGNPGRYGKELNIIKVVEPGGAAIATVFNLPFHPTAMPIDDLRYSADVAGEAERMIEQSHGGVGMFVNQCEGDVKANLNGTPRSEANTVRLGAELGGRVLGELSGIATTRDVPLDTLSQVEDMGTPRITIRCAQPTLNPIGSPVDSVCGFFAQLSLHPTFRLPIGGTASLVNWMNSRYRFSALRLGDQALITTLPGEGITNVGYGILGTLRGMNVQRPIIFGLCNGHMGYMTDGPQYDAGGREAESTLFGRETGDRVTEHTLFNAQHLVR